MNQYIEIFPRKCSVTGKGFITGYLAFDTEVYASEEALLQRLRERFEGDWVTMSGAPASDEWVLHEWEDDYCYTTFPYDDVDESGHPVAYTRDGQCVRLTEDVDQWEVRPSRTLHNLTVEQAIGTHYG